MGKVEGGGGGKGVEEEKGKLRNGEGKFARRWGKDAEERRKEGAGRGTGVDLDQVRFAHVLDVA